MKDKQTNRLINETSPYLLQHAHNPVDWYPWGEEAFTRAREEDKPLLLSIGYSACHWCHVMEEESFENENIAGIMNTYFVNIKVDREERPDIDEVYQSALQLMGRGGGWPLTVFLTPDGKPFFGGTYFPPVGRFGLKGFPDVLQAVAKAYRAGRREIEETAQEIKKVLASVTEKTQSGRDLNLHEVDSASSSLLRFYDPSHGGFGSAPKFPNTMQLSLLLRYYRRSGDPLAITAVKDSLRNMADGGIHDQLGGGFHRYSVDERWLIPHFEKMLYDNALLAEIYIDTYRVTGEEFFKEIGEKTLGYMIREMSPLGGGFYTAQDADSEGVEGKYFVWTKEEIESVLGEDAEVLCRFYGVTGEGNFEGKNILHVDRGLKAVSHEFDIEEGKVKEMVEKGVKRLFAVRERRVKPFKDTKIITGWNGLAISAMIQGYMATGKDEYMDRAKESIDFIKSNLYKEGELMHVWKDGAAKFRGDLQDYAFITAAALDMFEATLDNAYLDWAESLSDSMIDLFHDRERGGFYNTAADGGRLFHRMKTGNDQSIPSGSTVAASDLIRLSHYRDKEAYRSIAEGAIRLYFDNAMDEPFNYAGILMTSYLLIDGIREITIVGGRDSSAVKEMLRKMGEMYLPDKVIFLIDKGAGGYVPGFAREKGMKDDKVTVYVCKHNTCSEPLTEWEDIERTLS